MEGMLFLFGISGGEILVIMLLVLLLFGPSKIPEIARMLGRGINEVKKVQREINTEIQRYSADVEKEAQKIKSDIQDLKKTIEETNDNVASGDGAEKVDNLKGDDIKGDASKEGKAKESGDSDKHAGTDMEAGSPYEYDYDQYGLEDPYGTTFGKTDKTTSEEIKKDSRSPESTTSSNPELPADEALTPGDYGEDHGAGSGKKLEDSPGTIQKDATKKEGKEPGDKKQDGRKQQSPKPRKKKTAKNPGGDNL